MSHEDQVTNAAVNRALYELVSRYGEAASLDLSAYDGAAGIVDQAKRSLKGIAESRLGKTPMEAARNIHQQAGFSAEVIETTEINKHRIINGEKVRSIRTDDLGKTNDRLVDVVDVKQQKDGTLKELAGSSYQMKFIGKNGAEAFDKLCQTRHQKYYDNGVPVKIPKNYMGDFFARADERIDHVRQELRALRANGASPDVIASKREQLKRLQTVRNNTFGSETTSGDAMLARTNPKLYTAKSMLSTAHEAGLEGAAFGAAVGGGMSIAVNFAAVLQGKPIDEAIKDVAIKSATSAARAYAVSGGATLIDAGFRHYRSSLPQLLKNAKAPTEIAGFVVDAATAFYDYYSGNISGVQCLGRLASSASFALISLTPIGQAVFIARTVYTLVSISVAVIRNALSAPQMARERRYQIEQECAEQILALRAFREEYEHRSQMWLKQTTETFVSAFDTMDIALQTDDVDAYIAGANSITRALGGKPQFENFEEFDRFMESDEPFKL